MRILLYVTNAVTLFTVSLPDITGRLDCFQQSSQDGCTVIILWCDTGTGVGLENDTKDATRIRSQNNTKYESDKNRHRLSHIYDNRLENYTGSFLISTHQGI